MSDNQKQENVIDRQQMLFEIQMLDRESKQLQQHLTQTDQQLVELDITKNAISELNNFEKGREILVPIAPGIFATAKIDNNSEVLINVGSGVVVSKTIEQAIALIKTQTEEVRKSQDMVIKELEKISNRINEIEMQLYLNSKEDKKQ